MNEQEFAQRLRQYRKNKGMTQQELADQLGVSNKTVSRWESGSYPDVTTMVALARVLGVTVDELLDPKAPVRTLEKSDWQNLLSFAFAIGGGLLFYLLAQFVPLPLCWVLYLGCLAYGIYLQAHYTYHTHWFQLGVWVMVFFVSWSVVGMLLSGAGAVLGAVSMATFLERFWYVLEMGTSIGGVVLHLLVYFLIWTGLTIALSYLTGACIRPQFSLGLPEGDPAATFMSDKVLLDEGSARAGPFDSHGVLVPVLARRFAWVALCLAGRTLPSGLGRDQLADYAAAAEKRTAGDAGGRLGIFRASGLSKGL